jgi:pSer/pThr/pTyr-binding forkhead associated (FHA) protein
MPKRTLVIDGADRGHFFLCVEGTTLSIGDSPRHTEMVLRNLHIARVRCEVEVEDDLVVAGNPATLTSRRELRPGEDLRIGHSYLRFVKAAGEETAAAPPRVPAAGPEPADPAPSLPPVARSRPAADAPTAPGLKQLVVFDGADRGRAFRLPAAGSVTLGKSARHVDIHLNDLYVSRVHCVIEVREGRAYVTHSEGARETLIQGTQVTSEQELPLGGVLRVGNSHLRLETVSEGSSPSEEADTVEVVEEEFEVVEEVEEEIEVVEEAELTATRVESSAVEEAGPSAQPPRERLLHLEGEVLGQYRIGPLLGRGHSGPVFRAAHLTTNLVVSLKVLSPDFPATGGELQRFVQAQKINSQVHHTNLVTVCGAGRSGPYCWIAREYVEGESAARLVQRCQERGRFPWTLAARVALHLGKAAACLHRHRLVHRNITPRNILIRKEDKTARLADLMLAQSLEGSQLQQAVQEKKRLAELPWMAPEQVDRSAFVDHLADLYAVGAVVYTLLTGQPPFTADSPAETIALIRGAKVVRPTAYQDEIPDSFEGVVLKLLARRQEDRYQSAVELLADLEAIAREHEIEEDAGARRPD